MSNDRDTKFADYWYDGFESDRHQGRVVFRTFWQLPIFRKMLYFVAFGCFLLLKAVLSCLKPSMIPSLCDGLEYPPSKTPLESFGASKQDKERSDADGTHYLDEEEIAKFNRDGVIGPFRAISEDQAAELLRRSKDSWHNVDTKKAMEARLGNATALHKEVPEFAELWRNPIIANKLASLLGSDPQVWRSQLFPLPPGSNGTFWHQATTFREGKKQPSVLPPEGKNDNIAQLTVWCALTEADKEHGCLRFLKRSQEIQIAVDFFNNMRYSRTKLLSTIARRNLGFIHNYLICFLGQKTIGGSAFPLIMPIFDEFLKVYSKFFDRHCEPISMEMKPGEFVIFTSATMHGSWPNVTDEHRVACAARVAATGAHIHENFDDARLRLFEQPSPSIQNGPARNRATRNEECTVAVD